jgi:hypothetical protein
LSVSNTRGQGPTVDAEALEQLHGWTSLPFDLDEHMRIAVRVITPDGNSAELVRDLGQDSNT